MSLIVTNEGSINVNLFNNFFDLTSSSKLKYFSLKLGNYYLEIQEPIGLKLFPRIESYYYDEIKERDEIELSLELEQIMDSYDKEQEIVNEMYCENDVELRKQEEYNLDVIMLAEDLFKNYILIDDFEKSPEFYYKKAKEFIDYGAKHFPHNLT